MEILQFSFINTLQCCCEIREILLEKFPHSPYLLLLTLDPKFIVGDTKAEQYSPVTKYYTSGIAA